MLDGQPFTQVITPAGAALFLVQDGRRRFTAQLLQLVMQPAEQPFKVIAVLQCHLVTAAITQAETQVNELQQILITFGFAHQAFQQDVHLLAAPGFVMEMHQQGLLQPAVLRIPTVP
ncbi:hypothetical protein D3C81_1765290 [compost metagenome]